MKQLLKSILVACCLLWGSILKAQQLQLTAPVGGETWLGASQQTISWTYLNVDDIHLEYSLDSGLTWNTIIAQLPASALSYTWQVPAIGTTTARLRITSILDFTQSTSAPFTIPEPTLNLLYPDGGEQFTQGTGQYLAWESTGIDSLAIEYTLNNSSSWYLLRKVEAKYQYTNWVVPDSLTTQAKFRLYNLENTQNRDSSAANFSIIPATPINGAKYHGGKHDGYKMANNLTTHITLQSPNGGEQWVPNVGDTIRWTSNNLDHITLEYTINNGATWNLIDSLITVDQHYYIWNVPNTPSDSCLIRATSNNPAASDSSNNFFSIVAPTMQVTYPNGGESFGGGTGQYIEWIADGIGTLLLEYSTDNGTTWNTIDTATASHRYANWIPPMVFGSTHKIRISDYYNPATQDESDAAFTIFELAPTNPAKYHGGAFDGYAMANDAPTGVTVVSPNGNELWYSASNQAITWGYNNATSLTIEVTLNDGISWDTIATQVPASQLSYDWLVPTTPSNLGRVRITDEATGMTDMSDNPFIIPNAYVSITYPNGGESFGAGTGQYIEWNQAYLGTLKLEYSTDSGATWAIIGTAQAADQYANWVIPNTISTGLLIRATDVNNPNYTDVSNLTFSSHVLAPLNNDKYKGGQFDGYSMYRFFDDYVQVRKPNGGEIWGNGTLHTLEWATLNTIENINIELTTDNGVSYTTLQQNIPYSPKSWDWLINAPISNLCKIRISTVSGALVDESDNFFTIANTTGIVTQPIQDTSYCSTDTIQVNFTVGTSFLPGNEFIVQLSDSVGSFNGAVENIGSINGTSAQTIVATLPEKYYESSDYRLRVISTNPPTIGTDIGFDFEIKPLPTIDLGADTILCAGDTIQLPSEGNFITSRLWNTGSTDSIVAITQLGTYSVVVSNSCGTNSDTINIGSLTPPQVDLGNDTNVCVNEVVQFNAGASNNAYLWSTGSTDSTLQTAIAGTYRVTVSNACFSVSDSVELSNYAPIGVNLGNNVGLCNGSTQVLDATQSAAATYLWNTGATSPTITVSLPGSYWVQVSNQCETVSDQVVLIDGAIQTQLQDTSYVCSGDSVQLLAFGGNSYTWSNGLTGSSIWVNPPNSMLYTVTATNIYNCSTIDSAYVSVVDAVNSSQTISVLTSYTWPVTNETYTQSGTYSDTLTSAFGCDSILTLNLTITPNLQLSVYLSDSVICNGEIIQVGVQANVANAPQYPAGTVHCNGIPTAVVDVTNPITGKTWMDRNLGASQAATSSTDAASYGDLYQWGRGADGHQCRNSATTTTLSSTDQPGHGDFILAQNSPYDWRSPQNNSLWQGVNGVNNPCPIGYRLPTLSELDGERLTWSNTSVTGAFLSPLKLPAAGIRVFNSGLFIELGTEGIYWSNNINTVSYRSKGISTRLLAEIEGNRAVGFSIRCIKD